MAKGNTVNPEPSIESRTTRQFLVVAGLVFTVWLALQLRVLIVDIVVAITLASAIAPIAVLAEKKGVPRWVTVVLTYILVFVFYGTVVALLKGPIVEQGTALANNIPRYIDNANNWYTQLGEQFDFHPNLKVTDADFQRIGTTILNRTIDASFGMVGVLLNIVLILFLAAYFVSNSRKIWTGILSWVPTVHRAKVEGLIGPVGSRMGGYVRGQMLVSTAVAVFFAIGLSLIGVKYALVLGLVAGLMNLIPFVGSAITTVLAVVIAANDSILKAGLTLGLFALEQAVESHFIVPYLLGSQVELDPLIVLLAILVGGTLGGAVGALIAVPVAAALILIAQELYLKPMQASEQTT
jgi:predicted PurR-regulated permease PerM